MAPEDDPADEKRAGKCERCDGTGEIRWPSEDGGSPPMVCPACNGSGLDGTGTA